MSMIHERRVPDQHDRSRQLVECIFRGVCRISISIMQKWR